MAISEQAVGNMTLPVLETDLVRTFVAISDTGSFSRAAEAVFRTPSAVSMQMKRLEEILGRELFVRDGRGVALSADGEELLSYARRIIRLNEETVARFVAPPLEGTVRLGTPDDFATRFLPQALGRFARSYPQVQVEVVCAMSVELLKRLRRRDIDMTLITQTPDLPHDSRAEVVFREELVWAGLADGQAVRRRPLPLTASPPGCSWRASGVRALDGAGISHHFAFLSAHYAGEQAAMLADLGVAPVPLSAVAPPLRVFGAGDGLPPIGLYEVGLVRAPGTEGPVFDALAAHIKESFNGRPPTAA